MEIDGRELCSVVKTILIVDDQKGVRLLLEEFFKQEGYTVLTAGNGQEAIKETKEQKVDLIIMDMKMPGMDGLKAAEVILQDKYIPIILMTAYAKAEIEEAAMAVGINRCIVKPFEVLELREIVVNF